MTIYRREIDGFVRELQQILDDMNNLEINDVDAFTALKQLNMHFYDKHIELSESGSLDLRDYLKGKSHTDVKQSLIDQLSRGNKSQKGAYPRSID